MYDNTGITSFSFLCRQQHIVGQKLSTNCQMAALPDCFLSSSCLILREYWNLGHVQQLKIILLYIVIVFLREMNR